MTAADEQLVAALAEALRASSYWVGTHESFARDFVLPVVLADRRRAIAEALREAAEELHVQRFNDDPAPERRWPKGAPKAPNLYYAGIVRARVLLRERADTVEAGEER